MTRKKDKYYNKHQKDERKPIYKISANIHLHYICKILSPSAYLDTETTREIYNKVTEQTHLSEVASLYYFPNLLRSTQGQSN